MAVVINEFEVMPKSPVDEDQNRTANADGKNSQKAEMTDHEIKDLLERRAEREVRISAH